jgi:hypothetical protein
LSKVGWCLTERHGPSNALPSRDSLILNHDS